MTTRLLGCGRPYLPLREAMALAGVAALLAACSSSSPPRGSNNGRIDPGYTTRAEVGSQNISITALNEFADQSVGQFVADVSSIPEIRDYRGTIIIGSIANNTRSVPTNDFETFMSRFRSSLVRNRVASNNVKFVESRAQWESTRRREGLLEEEDDLLQTGSGRSSGRRLNTDYVFFLNGDFSQVKRGNVSQYQLILTLTNYGDGAYVWSSEPFISKEISW